MRRKSHCHGIVIDDVNDPLTNLRFADDIMLVAQSRSDTTKMLRDLSEAAARKGLHMHFGKTKVLTTQQAGGEMQGIKLDDQIIQVMGLTDTERYLGRQLCVQNSTEAEIEHRLKAAWASFMKLKDELCNKRYNLRQRLRLFDSAITLVVCFGSCAWTMTKNLERLLQVAQRKMLRTVFGFRRHADMDWVAFMKESTSRLLADMAKYRVRDWNTLPRKHKWDFCRKDCCS